MNVSHDMSTHLGTVYAQICKICETHATHATDAISTNVGPIFENTPFLPIVFPLCPIFLLVGT